MTREISNQEKSRLIVPVAGAVGDASPPDGSIEMARILDVPPILAPQVLRNDIRFTPAWSHSGMQANYMRGIHGHIAVACHEGEHDISWRVENKLFASRTSRKAFTLIPTGVDGHWHISGPVVVSHVYLTHQRLQACSDDVAGGKRVELLVRVAFKDPAVAGLLQILSYEATRASESTRLFVEQTIDLLCLRIVSEHSAFGARQISVARRGLADWQVKKVHSYMRERLCDAIGLDELAQLVGLSRYHFCTAFRLATGQTPYARLTAERMGRAREMLVDQQFSITDVALAVGYATPSAFSAAFRKAVGHTPTEYRRRL